MWAAPLRAPPPTQYVSSSPGTLVRRGTFWSPCVPARPSLLPCAPQSSTLPASISLAPLRAGGGKLFTLGSFASVGKSWKDREGEKKRGKFASHSLFPQVSEVPLVPGFLFNRFCSSHVGAGQCLHWAAVSGHVQRSRGLCGRHPLRVRSRLLWIRLLSA